MNKKCVTCKYEKEGYCNYLGEKSLLCEHKKEIGCFMHKNK